jgi:peptidoglycan/xylan/chitin deacetylase (PgdA/CDA1 family)
VAITYDDGPYIYTNQVLDQFAEYGFKATFFITGNNLGKGAIDTTENWASVIRRMDAEGHQVASHTWSHQDLSAITDAQRYDQMVKNEMAIRNILGKYPTYMRPPYSSCNDACQTVLKNLGYIGESPKRFACQRHLTEFQCLIFHLIPMIIISSPISKLQRIISSVFLTRLPNLVTNLLLRTTYTR